MSKRLYSVINQSRVQHATAIAQQLLATAEVRIEPTEVSGRNSRVYRVTSGERNFALKEYPARRDDPRQRLHTEVGALRLMERHGLHTVPRVVATDENRGYALLEWIDGRPMAEVAAGDIDQALAFVAAIHALRRSDAATAQPMASEACLSAAEIVRQIDARLEVLLRHAAEPALGVFLADQFSPAQARLVGDAEVGCRAAGINFGMPLPPDCRTLIPADFGFHNSLRRHDGTLIFLDFEYFGWDDPVKLVADFLLHPGMALSPPLRTRFLAGARDIYADDPTFPARLNKLYPLFGLRWVLILLNEFIPERWQRRVAVRIEGSWSEIKARQLARAHELLTSLQRGMHG